MINRRNINHDTVYDIIEFECESNMQVIVDLLSQKYLVSIIEKLEGPGTTIWYLNVSGEKIALVNNFYGNFFRPINSDAAIFFEKEYDNLNQLIKVISHTPGQNL